MSYIDEKVVLRFYLEELEKDNINFLRGHHKQRVKERVERLLEDGSIHTKIEAAKDLWKALFEAAMSYIDPDKRGYDRLFAYFDEFVDFEELIFASDSFYRDHTLHSLWVYFLGEYIYRNKEFYYIVKDTGYSTKLMKRALEEVKAANRDNVLDQLIKLLTEIVGISDKLEGGRCVAALCHDLGYPLKKIEKINKSIKGVLPYFNINNIDEFKFKYTEIEQMYIEKFINMLSTEIGALVDVKDIETDQIMEKFIKQENGSLSGVDINKVNELTHKEMEKIKKYLRVKFRTILNTDKYLSNSRSFEEYKHGIMSAFLLTKNLKAFENMDIKYANTEISIEKVNYVQTIMKQIILMAMTEHTNDSYLIQNMEDIISVLTFIDELEEFSRISRANKNREYVEQFCHTRLFMEDNWFNIEFIFDNENLGNLDPERAFKGRCERFLKLFDIPNLAENLKIRLKCIGKLESNQNEYMLEIANKYVKIAINDEEQFIPKYLKSTEYYSREEYQIM